MNCRQARRRIPLHAGGDRVRGAEALEAHLAECPACRRELEVLRAIRGRLAECGRGPSPAAGPEFLAGVYRRAEAGPRPVASPARWVLPAAAVAGVAAAALLAVLILGPGALERPTRVPGPAAGPGTGPSPDPRAEVATAPALPEPSFVGFGLPMAEPPEDANHVVGTVGLAPDPASANDDAAEGYSLREAEPAGEAELCADF